MILLPAGDCPAEPLFFHSFFSSCSTCLIFFFTRTAPPSAPSAPSPPPAPPAPHPPPAFRLNFCFREFYNKPTWFIYKWKFRVCIDQKGSWSILTRDSISVTLCGTHIGPSVCWLVGWTDRWMDGRIDGRTMRNIVYRVVYTRLKNPTCITRFTPLFLILRVTLYIIKHPQIENKSKYFETIDIMIVTMSILTENSRKDVFDKSKHCCLKRFFCDWLRVILIMT